MPKRINPVQKTLPGKGFNRKICPLIIIINNNTFFQVNGHIGTGSSEQPCVCGGINLDGQQAVLKGVTFENVGNVRTDDCPEAKIA